MTLRIVDWDRHFENNRTRELRSLAWVPFPNRHDGDGYTQLLDHKNGASHFGAWVALVQVASKCDVTAPGCDEVRGGRGTLLRTPDLAHDPRSLSRITRIPIGVFTEAIPRLIEIGWIEDIPLTSSELGEESHFDAAMSHLGAGLPQEGAAFLNGREGNGKKGRERKPASEPEGFSEFWQVYPRKIAKGEARKVWPRALVAAGGDLAAIVDAAGAFARSPIGTGDPKFIPHPATWLNAEQWTDDPASWNAGDRSDKPKPPRRDYDRIFSEGMS